ncbi:MAG: serine protease, partial [Mycobacterium sp.]
MRILAAAVGSALVLAMLSAACERHADSAPLTTTPEQLVADSAQHPIVAGPVDPDARVGAIFFGDGDLHGCTGSVVHSASGDLVLTAAHCLGPVISA